MRLKLLLLITILFTAFGIFSFLQNRENKDIEKLANDTANSIKIIYKSSFDTYKLSAQKELYDLMNNKEAIDILTKFKTASIENKKLLRGDLYRLFSKRYKYLKTLDVRQFHFHTHEGKSLLRFHVPHSNGDDLMNTRYSIKTANTKFKPVYGFEGGKIYPGFRYLFPIVKDGIHLGSIEYSVSFEAIEKRIKKTFPNYTYHLHLDGSISYNKVFKWYKNYFEISAFGNNHYIENKALSPVTNRVKENSLIKQLNTKIVNSLNFNDKFNTKEDFNIPIFINRQGYIVSFLSIFDTTNNHAAYLISYAKNDYLVAIKDKYAILYIIGFTILMLLYVLTYIILHQIEKIMMQNEKLEKININQVEKITEQNDELQMIFNTTKDGIAMTDLNTNFLFSNKAYQDITGFTQEELLTKSCVGLSVPENLVKVSESLDEVMDKGYIENLEKTCIVKDGKRIHVNISIALMPDHQKLLLSVKDMTDYKSKENTINEYVKLIDKNIITSSTDLNGNITSVSDAFCRISGYSRFEIIGRNHNIIKHPDMDISVFKNMWDTIIEDKVWTGEIKNQKKDKSYYWVNATITPSYDINGKKVGYTAIRQDITDKKIIEIISITDGLTNIFNRRHFNELFPKFINSAKRKNELVCFLIMDIDYFKQYNDTYGHQMGDNVLCSVSLCIKDSLKRANDYCFRLGGEEFGVIFNVERIEQSIMFANTIKQNIENLQIEHSKSEVSEYITVSMGLLCKSANDIDDDNIAYKEADELLYKAKHAGRNHVISN